MSSNSSAHLETLWTLFAMNTNKQVKTYCLLNKMMSDGIECLSEEEHVTTKTNNKRKHDDLGSDSMLPKKLLPKKHKRVPSPEKEESEEVSHIRSHVLLKLVNRLQKAEAGEQGKQEPARVIAEAFERLLYALASSIEDHADSASIDTRLNTIFSALIQRRNRKCPGHPMNRHPALRLALGHEKYQVLESLLNKLYLIRLGRAEPCCGRMCQESSCTVMATTVVPAPPLPKGQKMPTAVRNLFFGTRLMHFEYDPVCRWEDLPLVYWDELIKEAEKHVDDYHAWCSKMSSRFTIAAS